ncbi:uncharacterized protein K441DRAFT_699377 [Cenococcum geophilum 1.58]|uniref:uncharacterized protein n=1 Tax=Cenococcum geophilum 1.58 TaxID=794803 RepID=UPI00358FA07E|nr:hypothetical protein K441DRAFT_699377 [Cenococcum geophilum 1.58]
MEFMPQVASPTHPPLKVPSFVSPDNIYQPGGLDTWLSYPHREGYNIEDIIEGNFQGKTWNETAAFVQRWAYWGMIEEILRIGGMQGTVFGANPSDESLREFSAQLLYTLLVWECIDVDPEHPEAEEIRLDRFTDMAVIFKRVNWFYIKLCSREASSWGKSRRNVPKHNATPIYTKHVHPLHPKDECAWDDYDTIEKGEKSFFTEEPHSEGSPFESPGHALILSIGVVGELLSCAAERKYEYNLEDLKWTIPLTLVRRMDLAGWCPVWLKKLRDEGSLWRAYYLSSIRREPIGKHAHCCFFGCTADQVKTPTYKPKHRDEACNCEMVSFDLGDETEFAGWIREGHTPLIVGYREHTAGPTRYKLIRSHEVGSKEAKRYVAMSHVWADGTGSVDGNSLPTCQLEKFQDGANQLYKSELGQFVPFWCDTVCVPYNRGPLKILAIQKMEQVYRDADGVLVFDRSLQQISLDSPTSECLTQIETSSWNQRLWTIQEAAFAKTLYFQFKDGITDLRDLRLRYRSDRFKSLIAHWRDLENRFSPLFKLRQMVGRREDSGIHLIKAVLEMHLQPVLDDEDVLVNNPSSIEKQGLELDTIFVRASNAVAAFIQTLQLPHNESQSAARKWNALGELLPYRQTSIVSDEGLCLSTLLGIDLEPLYDLPDEERVRRMFLHIGTIGSSILFGSRPRLEKPGYRWMPSTFVSQRLEPSHKTAQVTESGVKAKLHGIRVEFPPEGYMSRTQPGGIEGHFGFLKIDDDDEDEKGHLVGRSFPIRLRGTSELFFVNCLLPEEIPGFMAIGSAVYIVLEEDLESETLPPEFSYHAGAVAVYEWRQLQRKAIVEGFVVHPATEHREAYKYMFPVNLSSVHSPTLRQLAMAAEATQMGEVEWLIS